jgi:hypothetical protein
MSMSLPVCRLANGQTERRGVLVKPLAVALTAVIGPPALSRGSALANPVADLVDQISAVG